MSTYDPDVALERIQQDIQEAAERARRAEAARVEVEAIRARAASPRGEVQVEVDAAGLLRDLRFDQDALRLQPDALSRLVLDVIASAQRQAGARAVAVAEDTFGAGSPVSEHLRAEVRERFARVIPDEQHR